jgi:secreted PhoX family phosphatase
MNCSGSKTPWKTWISCEEYSPDGQIYQVDPFGRRQAEKTMIRTRQGGRYQAFAYDDRNKTQPVFNVTEDQRNGPTRRFNFDPILLFQALKMIHGACCMVIKVKWTTFH